MATETKVHEATANAARDELREAMKTPVTPPVHVPRPASTHGQGVLGSKLTVEHIALIKSTLMRGASDDDVAIFVLVCNRTGLDPFARQIHAVKRRSKVDNEWVEKWVFQVGIDGFRLIADRTGKYDGQFEPEFYDEGGNARKVWFDRVKPPVAARVGVLRKGIREPFYVTAHFAEYVQEYNGNPTGQWKSKPVLMLAKCAEAAALRKAFPQELSGLYTDDEMSHADEVDETEARAERPVASARATVSMANAARATEDGDVELLFRPFNGKKVSELSLEDLTILVAGWNDAERRATAEQRLGEGAVKVIAAAYKAKKQEADTAKAAATPGTQPAIPTYIANLIKREAAGEQLADTDVDELRLWREDHPEAAHG